MVLLREEQLKFRVGIVAKQVAEEMQFYRGNFQSLKQPRPWLELFDVDFLAPRSVIGNYSIEEVNLKFKTVMRENGMEKVPFELALGTFDRRNYPLYQKKTAGFLKAVSDTLENYTLVRGFSMQSNLLGENLVLNEALYVSVPHVKNVVLQSLRWRIVASLLFTLIILAAFYVTVHTLLQQKKLSEIKNDFINNMTHEFKTPLATISLAVDAMRNEKVIQDRERLAYFNGIIKEENLRMNRQVETILKASQLERNEVELKLRAVSLQALVQQVVDNFGLQLEHTGGQITLSLRATRDQVMADEIHLSNLINNLIDNAIKYAREGVSPHIQITTLVQGKQIQLIIEDNGMGMSRDTLKRIFEKFYRAHTGNRHDVKGFGLGLSYVKTVTEALGGTIKADSTPGKGSVFTLSLPLAAA